MQDLCDKKFAHGLPVAVLPPIMLLGPHLEDDDLGSFEVLNDLRLDSDIVQVWPPHLKLAIILQRKHPWEADSATWLRLEPVAGIQPVLLDQVLHTTSLYDSVFV